MSVSLVADYDSSSSESEDESSELRKEEATVQLASALEMLDENNSNISSSVFSNPYREAESYEQSVLERHVKMTTVEKIDTSKQKKICFKFNKGKCTLGDKCKFFHHDPSKVISEKNNSDCEEDSNTSVKKVTKKRCGLKDDLVPPKKYVKFYKPNK